MDLVDLLIIVRFMENLRAEHGRAPDICPGVALGIWLGPKHEHKVNCRKVGPARLLSMLLLLVFLFFLSVVLETGPST